MRMGRVWVSLWLVWGGVAHAGDWPGWRGALGSGLVDEPSGWRDGQWLLRGPVWQAALGPGATSPIVVEGRVYVLGWSEGSDTLYCFDLATGREQWRGSYACPPYGRHAVGDQGFYKGPSATPTHDPQTGLLYTLSADGDLLCWDTRTAGRIVWRRSLHAEARTSQRPDAGGGVRDFGYTTAPFLFGDWVIAEAGGADGNLVAFDKGGGAVRWRSRNTDPAGHSGGLVALTVGGIPCVVVLTLRGPVVTRLDAEHLGETLGSYPWQPWYAQNIPTPAVAGHHLVVTSGYDPARTIKLEATQDGLRRVWEAEAHSTVASPIVYRDHVYLVGGQVRCLDLASGAERWSGGQFGDDASAVVTADGRLVVFGNRRLALVDTADHSPSAYRELALRPEVGEAYSWPHLVLAQGRLLARDSQGGLLCFEVGN